VVWKGTSYGEVEVEVRRVECGRLFAGFKRVKEVEVKVGG
jgi:hypothetical protein